MPPPRSPSPSNSPTTPAARTAGAPLHLRLEDPEGLPNGAEEVRIALTLPAEDLGPLRYEPAHVDVGHWVADDLRLPRPGDWELSLTLRTSEIDQTTETTTLTVG
ncbi:hypothetical protein [Streptomyces harbinensis]|uniref:hypothetical protein n=1 Tax=Streptomyces harbinensis TaxID=1176198 RepID=UPI0034DFB369